MNNRAKVTGKEIAAALGEDGVKHLIRNYKIYHTVDPMYVLEDCQDYWGIKLFNGFD